MDITKQAVSLFLPALLGPPFTLRRKSSIQTMSGSWDLSAQVLPCPCHSPGPATQTWLIAAPQASKAQGFHPSFFLCLDHLLHLLLAKSHLNNNLSIISGGTKVAPGPPDVANSSVKHSYSFLAPMMTTVGCGFIFSTSVFPAVHSPRVGK